MGKIKVLPPSVIQQIAAGEVAESPAVIIKELLENAIDANATEIEIQLQKAGLDQIIVSDNGTGMDESDLRLAYQRHTTSKIRQLDDLWHIQTLGFRGEALASINQVSHLQIITRPATHPVGYQVLVHQDQLLEAKPMATQPGTTVIIEQLFAAQPVRKKFLKTQAAELKAIIQVISAMAISHPQVSFNLKNDHAVLLHLPQTEELHDRVVNLLALPPQSLVPIDYHAPHFSLTGYLAATPTTYAHAQQFLSLNQRPITHAALNKVIKNAFGTLLEKTTFPSFALNLVLPSAKYNVHIHPHKETVQLADEQTLLNEVGKIITQALQRTTPVPTFEPLTRPSNSSTVRLYPEFKAQLLAEPAATLATIWQPEATETEILQLDLTYLALTTPKGFLLVDQHAAHERILYESFQAQLLASPLSKTVIELPTPTSLALTPPQFLTIEEHLPTLEQLGFHFAQTGRYCWVLEGVPKLFVSLSTVDLQNLVLKLLHLLEEKTISLTSLSHELLARLACRSATQAGDFLTPAQRSKLLHQLLKTPNQTTCPHGRPTTLLLDIPTLEKKFKRRK